jgi:hypothetical protein
MGQDLTNLNIKDTYEDLVQISGSNILTDGLGNTINNLSITSSHATTADSVISASFSQTSVSSSHALVSDLATTASYALTSTSSSYALTASYAENATIPTLEEVLTAGNVGGGGQTIILSGSGIEQRTFSTDSITSGIAGSDFTIQGGSSGAGLVLTGNGNLGNNYIKLNEASGIQISGSVKSFNDITAPTFSGSLYGNALTATTASYALTASYVESVVSASYAVSSSHSDISDFAFTATSASYATTATLALSSSHANNSDTAISSSYALTSTSSSYAITASYAENAGSPFPYTGSADISGSLNVVGQLNLYDNKTNANGINIGVIGQTANVVPGFPANPGVAIGYGNTGAYNQHFVIGKNNTMVFQGNGEPSFVFGRNNTIGGNANKGNVILGTSHAMSSDAQYTIFAGGDSHQLSGNLSNYSGIVAGLNNTLAHSQSVILGGENITTTAHGTTFTPNLCLTGSSAVLTFGDGTTQTTAAVGFPYTGSAGISGSLNVVGQVALGNSSVPTGQYSFIGGGQSNTAVGQYAAVIGGNNGQAKQLRSIVLGGEGNATNSPGQGQIVAGGINNSANGDYSVVAGGSSNTAVGQWAVVIGGNSGQAATLRSVVLGGEGNQASGSVVGEVGVLTDVAGTTTMDCSLGNFFTLAMPAGGSTTLTPSNIQAGQTINVKITQNATPSTIAFDASVDFEGGTAFAVSTGAGEVDVMTFISFDGTSLQATGLKNFS